MVVRGCVGHRGCVCFTRLRIELSHFESMFRVKVFVLMEATPSAAECSRLDPQPPSSPMKICGREERREGWEEREEREEKGEGAQRREWREDGGMRRERRERREHRGGSGEKMEG